MIIDDSVDGDARLFIGNVLWALRRRRGIVDDDLCAYTIHREDGTVVYANDVARVEAMVNAIGDGEG